MRDENTKSLVLNAKALYHGEWAGKGASTLGCDEACQAYIMVGMLRSEQGRSKKSEYIAGFEPEKCTFRNVDDVALPLRWEDSPQLPPTGTVVRLRIFFRDATIFAVDFNDKTIA